MGAYHVFIPVECLPDGAPGRPVADFRALFEQVGLVVPELDEGSNEHWLEVSTPGNATLYLDSDIHVKGSFVASFTVYRPCGRGYAAFCLHLLRAGFLMCTNAGEFYASAESISSTPVLHDPKAFSGGVMPIEDERGFGFVE